MPETIEKMKIMNAAQEVHLVLKMKETAILMLNAKVTLYVERTIALLIGAMQRLIVANHFNTNKHL